MSINGIMSSALSALLTNSQALRTVSNNVANINTPGYARRTVSLEASVVGGQLQGVDIASIQRVVDRFYDSEVLSATAGSSQYDVESTFFDQVNGFLGQPGDGTSLSSQLDSVFSALGSASLSPSSNVSRQGVLNAFRNLASSISSLSSQIGQLQTQADRQISASVGTINGLIQQIYQLNQKIQTAQAGGDTATGLLDSRDRAVQSLSQYIGVRTSEQPNGQLVVMTNDGINLVGDTYGTLSYAGGSTNGTYGEITVQDTSPDGAPIGTSQALDPHLDSGSLKGLIDMRDNQLGQLGRELGQFAQQTALAFNRAANAGSAYPPPTSLSGRDTGLVGTDALNFTGKTTVAITDSAGNLVSRIDVDFDAGTLSVDGGAAVSFAGTVGDFVDALNTALGANGSASFTDGKLSLSANGTNGIVVQDDATTPSARGGYGFSQFFGLNDIFQAQAPSILSTGLSAADDSGLAAGGEIDLVLKGPDGEIAKQGSVSITAGMTVGDVVSALNTAMNGAASFTLNSDGSLSMTPAGSYSDYQLNVTKDTTERGTTGMSFSVLFGLGTTQASAQAASFSLTSAMAGSPQNLPFAQSQIDATTAAGDSVVTSGDARGLLALQDVTNTRVSFSAAGGFPAQTGTLNDYISGFYQDVATRTQAAQTNQTTQSDRLTEAQSRQAQTSGVNLDEELSNMMMYQQAYNAGARMLSTVQQLYDTLLQLPI